MLRICSGKRICVTDPKRSRRNLLIRLETWIAREAWAVESGAHDYIERLEARLRDRRAAELLREHLHFLIHLRKNRRRPCPACTAWTRERLEEALHGRK